MRKEVGSLESPSCWLSHAFTHRVVIESSEPCSVCQYFDFLSSVGCRPVTISIANIGVLRMAPVTILMAWCCALHSLLELVFVAVEFAAIPYSRSGRILTRI